MMLVFWFELFHIFSCRGPFITDYTVRIFLIVEGRTVVHNCLNPLHSVLVHTCLIGNNTTYAYFHTRGKVTLQLGVFSRKEAHI